MERETRNDVSLLEKFSVCQTDIALLKILMKAYVDDENSIGSGMDQVMLRSIERAEAEADDIRVQYEQGEER